MITSRELILILQFNILLGDPIMMFLATMGITSILLCCFITAFLISNLVLITEILFDKLEEKINKNKLWKK